MPTPVTDLGSPLTNLFFAFWKAVRDDLRGEAPIFGAIPSKYNGLPSGERAIIEKEAARQSAEEFVTGKNFENWVGLTSILVDEPLDVDDFRSALYADHR